MASCTTLSSDPEHLLKFMHDLPDESDSEDDFDGYLGPDEGPIAYHSVTKTQEESPLFLYTTHYLYMT